MNLERGLAPLPTVMPYEAGHPLVPGYHLEERAKYGRIAVGTSLLVVGYVLTVASTFAISDPQGDSVESSIPNPGYSLIPLAGPFIEGVDALTPWVGAGFSISCTCRSPQCR